MAAAESKRPASAVFVRPIRVIGAAGSSQMGNVYPAHGTDWHGVSGSAGNAMEPDVSRSTMMLGRRRRASGCWPRPTAMPSGSSES